MNSQTRKDLQTAEPLFLLSVVQKIIENCLDFRKQIAELTKNKIKIESKYKKLEEEIQQDPKDFLLIMSQMEFQIMNHKKVSIFLKNFCIVFLIDNIFL